MKRIFGNQTPQGYSYELWYQQTMGLRPAPRLEDWQELISFRPPTLIQQELKDRGIHIHKFFEALDSYVNLDVYEVKISQFPSIGGSQGTTPEEFLEFLRMNINNFVGTFLLVSLAKFSPLETTDETRWMSRDPQKRLGAVLRIDIPGDNAAVVVGLSEPNRWIFSTVHTQETWGHPVTGHREFGFHQSAEDYFLYTRGVDMLTGEFDFFYTVFPMQVRLWNSFQEKVVTYINTHEGRATKIKRILHRPPKQELR